MIPGLNYEDQSDTRVGHRDDLINLVNEFTNGKHDAFGQHLYDKMNQIRDQQEQLVQNHFDFSLQQNMKEYDINNTRIKSEEFIDKLMKGLNNVSNSLHQLCEFKPTSDKD
ncbi:unnamed protein product [Gordionus sp. m RMFG-2023]|uniref:uncharacterized protein LOC135931949 n=1 Tax=Gordionus sp. m RMFG-2023 TaxID=3053472 RepID=UPI0030E25013